LLTLLVLLAAVTLAAAQNNQKNTPQNNQSKSTPPKQTTSAPASKPKLHEPNPSGDRKVGEGYNKTRRDIMKKRGADKPTAVAATRG
jgi:hypothetical protein